MFLKRLRVLVGLLVGACASGSAQDSGPAAGPTTLFGTPVPAAQPMPADPLPEPPLPSVDAGDGLTELGVSVSGPDGERTTMFVTDVDGGGRVDAPFSADRVPFRVKPLRTVLLHLVVDGGVALAVPFETGQAGSTLEVTDALVRLSRGLKLDAPRPGAPPSWNGHWVHRPTGAVVANAGGRAVVLTSAPSRPEGVEVTDVGAFAPTNTAPCFTRDSSLVFLEFATETVAFDLSTKRRLTGVPADASTAACQPARRGVPRVLLALRSGGALVLEWTATDVREVFREAGPVRATLSADGTTVGLMKPGATPSGWQAERITLATGAREAVTANGPATPLLPFDGRALYFLASPGAGGVWGPCTETPADPCQLIGATSTPLASVVGIALAESAAMATVAVREGVAQDRVLQLDLTTGTTTPLSIPNYSGLPPTRLVLRNNLLPTHRGIVRVPAGTVSHTGLGILRPALASDGSVWVATATNPGTPIGGVDNDTGAMLLGPFRQATLSGQVLRRGQRVISRSALSVLGGAATTPTTNDAVCIPFLAAELLDRAGNPLTQAAFCSP